MEGDKPTDGAEPIMWALARSPDPDLALRTVERLFGGGVRPVPPSTPRCAPMSACAAGCSPLLGSSTALGDHLVTHPDRWHRLASTDWPTAHAAAGHAC